MVGINYILLTMVFLYGLALLVVQQYKGWDQGQYTCGSDWYLIII